MKRILLCLPLLLLLMGLGAAMRDASASEPEVLYNQVGYINRAPKLLLVSEHVDQLIFRDADGRDVLTLQAGPEQLWEFSGTRIRKVDFSSLTVPGRYTLILPGNRQGPVITIMDKPYHKLTRSVLKIFYLSRLGMPIEEPYAGLWARPAAHPDTLVYIHASAAGPRRKEGDIISAPMGWYDAGDYNKYVVNSAITVYTLFRALEDFPDFYRKLNLNIPESGKGVPDILDEVMYNYRWMLSMQDPDDGGVYHKLTNKAFDKLILPHEAKATRYVVMKTTAATLDFAAVAAHASQLLKSYGNAYPGLAAESLQRAEQAWQWALQHPDLTYQQPSDISTGAYGDKQLKDEWFWAAAELYLATGKQVYADAILQYYQKPTTPEWATVHGLGFMSLLAQYQRLSPALQASSIRTDFFALADSLVRRSEQSPFAVSIRQFKWGSNSYVANEAMVKLFAYTLKPEQPYYRAALWDLDYLLGRNATGYCFVTGYGDKKVMHIHHRPCIADGIAEPWPGFLAGGPNLNSFTDCPDDKTRPRMPATSYLDAECSYTTNEVAINWNAPLAYLTGGMDRY